MFVILVPGKWRQVDSQFSVIGELRSMTVFLRILTVREGAREKEVREGAG